MSVDIVVARPCKTGDVVVDSTGTRFVLMPAPEYKLAIGDKVQFREYEEIATVLDLGMAGQTQVAIQWPNEVVQVLPQDVLRKVER